MKVLVPKYSGFCSGVQQAEKKLMDVKKQNPGKKICVLGELIHNTMYIDHLAKEGIFTVETTDDAKECDIVVIRTHGINRETEMKLRKAKKTVDLTCFKVKQLQRKINDYSNKGFYIVITGKKNHPEVLGLISYADAYMVIENKKDIEVFVKSDEFKDLKKILVVTQTTGDKELFVETYDTVKKHHAKTTEVQVINSFCTGTGLREQETMKLMGFADIVFVVGDPMSSNAKKLYNELLKKKTETFFIRNAEDCKLYCSREKKYKTALVVSSSSTPQFVEDEIVEYLQSV